VSAYGVVSTTLAGQLAGSLTGPGGGSIPFMRSDSFNDTTWGFGDLIPQFALRWNAGVNNYMTYITGDIPVGAYQSDRLSNIGIGHGAIDAGGGYTYFNPATGHEFSGVLGFTYNLKNTATQYQNGVDLHFDWGASQFHAEFGGSDRPTGWNTWLTFVISPAATPPPAPSRMITK
jgi:hypothetical protein